MCIRDRPKSLPPSSAFDYDRLAAHFAKVLELRKVDVYKRQLFPLDPRAAPLYDVQYLAFA